MNEGKVEWSLYAVSMVMQFADDEEGLCLKWSTGGGRSGCRVRDATGIAGSRMKEKSSAVRASVFDQIFFFFFFNHRITNFRGFGFASCLGP